MSLERRPSSSKKDDPNGLRQLPLFTDEPKKKEPTPANKPQAETQETIAVDLDALLKEIEENKEERAWNR